MKIMQPIVNIPVNKLNAAKKKKKPKKRAAKKKKKRQNIVKKKNIQRQNPIIQSLYYNTTPSRFKKLYYSTGRKSTYFDTVSFTNEKYGYIHATIGDKLYFYSDKYGKNMFGVLSQKRKKYAVISLPIVIGGIYEYENTMVPWKDVNQFPCVLDRLDLCSYVQMKKLKDDMDLETYRKYQNKLIRVVKDNFDFKHLRGIKKTKEGLKDLCRVLSNNKVTFIEERRARIRRELTKNKPINQNNIKMLMTDDFISKMLWLYDKLFFNGILQALYKLKKCRMAICVEDNRCFEAILGGLTVPGNKRTKTITIKLNREMFKNLNLNKFGRVYQDGIYCYDMITCFLLTFEHELCHALIWCNCEKEIKNNTNLGNWKGRSDASGGHSKTFMSMINNTFGHSHYTHGMIVEKKSIGMAFVPGSAINRKKLRIGDKVIISTFDNKNITGFIFQKTEQTAAVLLQPIELGRVEAISYFYLTLHPDENCRCSGCPKINKKRVLSKIRQLKRNK